MRDCTHDASNEQPYDSVLRHHGVGSKAGEARPTMEDSAGAGSLRQ